MTDEPEVPDFLKAPAVEGQPTKKREKKTAVSDPAFPDLDTSLFTQDELNKIAAEAEADVKAERKEETRAELLKRHKVLAKRQVDPNEELISVQIDVPGFADRIVLDGYPYFHGQTVDVPRRVYNTLVDIMQSAHRHEASTGNANRDQYRKPREVRINPLQANVPASSLMRV